MPGAQPSDLPNAQGLTLGQLFSPPGAPQTMGRYFGGTSARGVQGPAPQPTPTPMPNLPTPPAPGTSAPTLESLAAGLGGADAQPMGLGGATLEELAAGLGPQPYQPQRGDQFSEGGSQSWGELWQRLKASIGRTPKETASVLANAYGQENVRVRGDRVYFRKPGETKFRALDPKQFEFFGDLIADMGGPMLESTVAGPFEAAGLAAGTAESATGAGVVAAPAAIGAGIVAGAKAGNNARASALDLVGGQPDPSVNPWNELGTAVATNSAALGLGRVASKAYEKLSAALASRPLARLKQVAGVQAGIEDLARAYRVDGEQATAGEIGGAIKTVVQRERQRLNGVVEAAREMVVSSAGDQKFGVTNTLNTMKKLLQQQGATFDKDGTAAIAGKLSDESFPVLRQYERQSPLLGPDAKPIVTQELRPELVTVPGAPVQPPVSPMGTPKGPGNLSELADRYNQLLAASKNGGVDAEALFRMASDYGEMAKYQTHAGPGVAKSAATKTSRIWREVNQGAIADRDAAALQVLPMDSPELAAYRQAMQDYATRTDPLKRFENMLTRAEKQGAMPTLADGLIQPDKPQVIRQFKQLFGDSASGAESDLWKSVKGNWLTSVIDSPAVRDGTTGLISGKSLMSKINGYGKDVLKEVLEPEELGQLRKLSTKLDSIYKRDLTNPEEVATELATMPIWYKLSPRSMANALWSITSQNAKLADALLDEGFMNAFRQVGNEERTTIVGAMNQFRQMHDGSIRARLKSGVEALKLPESMKEYFGLVGRKVVRGNALGAGQSAATQIRPAAAATQKIIDDAKKALSQQGGSYLGYEQPDSSELGSAGTR